ncbi:hypothetical protein BKA56DRAFT_497033 [Ilyonectria sp. MPI-CAGE-AT-0026]|nr:hypothetical protein BKA56DRAFT_497033 [Ilyonectria sp. MPI-CAGE-AT-0026]
MQLPSEPVISLRLTPHFDADGASGISVLLKIEQPAALAGQPMFIFNTFTDNVPAPSFKEETIRARDGQGVVPIVFHDIPSRSRNTQQHWYPGRDTSGDVVLEFDVLPRLVDIKTPVGTRIDLRRDQGGLQAVGKWFLPRFISEKTHTNIVEWCLPPNAPEGTRCVWSFGEGPRPIVRVGRSDTIWDTVYMVGPIQSYPPTVSEVRDGSTCYWFGSLPDKLDRLKTYNTELFPKMMEYFGSSGGSYGVFIRKVLIGYGGTGFLGSYVLEYDETVLKQPDHFIISLFTHEMVHSFSKLDSEDDGYDNAWFTEGIADLYASLLPYRFGLRGKDYLIYTINSHVQAYFTNPRINMDIRDAAAEFFSDWYAVWIAYKRGYCYLMFIDCILRKAVGNFDIMSNSPLDEIVIDLARRTRKGERVTGKDWLEYLGRYLDADGFPFQQHFQRMLRGQTLDFSGTFAGHPSNAFVRDDMRILHFGFGRNSLRTHVLAHVEEGSQAYAAGLRNGDEIVSASNHNRCTEDVFATYTLTIKRGGHQETIEYYPRLERKTVSWTLSPGSFGLEER